MTFLSSLSPRRALAAAVALVVGGLLALAVADRASGGSFPCTFNCTQPDAPASLVGNVFEDSNANGVNDGEGPLSGFVVWVDYNANGSVDGNEPTATSDASGRYRISSITPGTYDVRQAPRPGFRCTAPPGCVRSTAIADGERRGPDFGNVRSNTVSGTVFEDANGNGAADAGEPGVPGATVFVDANSNGARDAGEPQATTNAAGHWAIEDVSPGTRSVRAIPPPGFSCTAPAGCVHTLEVTTSREGVNFAHRRGASDETGPPIGGPTAPPAVRGRSVQIGEVRGDVFVQLPPGQARAAQAPGFRPLQQLANIPVGSIIRATRGTVRLTAAQGARSAQQRTVLVSGGQFQVLQPNRRGAVAEMRLNGGSFASTCGSSKARAEAAGSRRTVRRVSARTRGRRGRFRTRGRYSTATVRGTVWTTTDRCDGTLTSVRRGVVSVRDLARRRTVTVRAGRSYLARPR